MIGSVEAKKLIKSTLKDDRRYAHSLDVAAKMGFLARYWKEPEELWYLTGLLHDIDLPETIDCLEKHGLLAVDKLQGLLPEEGIRAIMAHDFRTEPEPDTLLAQSLVFADMLEIMEHTAGPESIRLCREKGDWENLLHSFPGKEFHIGTIRDYYEKHRALPV